MSPASSGSPLEVERYIGACLISSQQSRHIKKQQYVQQDSLYTPQPVAGGGNQQYVDYRNCNSGERWAGGMPLISFANQSRSWNNNRLNNNNNNTQQEHNPLSRLGAPLILTNNKYRKNKARNNAQSAQTRITQDHKDTNTDTVSVASDESSANSDTCLPRIIKPRKRRKKDRKPPHLTRPLSQDSSGFSTSDSASPDLNTSPLIQYNYDPLSSYNPYSSVTTNDLETPKLHHSFEDIEELDLNGNLNESSCQCRYCDPSGQIWDIDRSCYSPFLTSPPTLFQFPIHSTNPITDLIDSIASCSLEDDLKSTNNAKPALEVSSEIVTSSLNGHRDIEIRFFSSAAGGGASSNNTSDKSENNCFPMHKNKCHSYLSEE